MTDWIKPGAPIAHFVTGRREHSLTVAELVQVAAAAALQWAGAIRRRQHG